MDLWDRSREPKMERSRDFAYKSSIYTGTATIDKHFYYIRFESMTRISSFSGRKVLVPVLSSLPNPEAVTVNSEPAGWVKKNNITMS